MRVSMAVCISEVRLRARVSIMKLKLHRRECEKKREKQKEELSSSNRKNGSSLMIVGNVCLRLSGDAFNRRAPLLTPKSIIVGYCQPGYYRVAPAISHYEYDVHQKREN